MVVIWMDFIKVSDILLVNKMIRTGFWSEICCIMDVYVKTFIITLDKLYSMSHGSFFVSYIYHGKKFYIFELKIKL